MGEHCKCILITAGITADVDGNAHLVFLAIDGNGLGDTAAQIHDRAVLTIDGADRGKVIVCRIDLNDLVGVDGGHVDLTIGCATAQVFGVTLLQQIHGTVLGTDDDPGIAVASVDIGMQQSAGGIHRLVVGIDIATGTDAPCEGMCALLHLLTTFAGLPVVVLIMLPVAHIGVVAGRLVVGIGIAAEADAVLELVSTLIHHIAAIGTGGPVAVLIMLPVAHIDVLAGGGDLLALADGFTAVGADGLAGVAGFAAGCLNSALDLGLGVLALGFIRFGGNINSVLAGQFRIAVQANQGNSAVQSTQGLCGIGAQIKSEQLNAVGGKIGADVDLVIADTGHGSTVLEGLIQLTQIGQRPAGVQHDLTFLQTAGHLQVVQITGLIQDQEVVIVQLVVLAQSGTGVHDCSKSVSKRALAKVDFSVGNREAIVLLNQEELRLTGGVFAVGGIDHIAAHGHGISLSVGAVHHSHIHRGNAGKVCGSIAVGMCGGTGDGVHCIAVVGIQLLEGVGGVAILACTGSGPQLVIEGSSSGKAGGILHQSLVSHGSGVDLGPDITAGGLNIAIDIIRLSGLGSGGIIGILGQGHAHIFRQNAQACQVDDAVQNAHLAQFQLHHIVAPQLSACGGCVGDQNALEIAGLHIDHGDIVIVSKLQAGGDVVNSPTTHGQQFTVFVVVADLIVLQHAVNAQHIVTVEPVTCGFLRLMVSNRCGCAAGIQFSTQIFAGSVVIQQNQEVCTGFVSAADINGMAADGHIGYSLLGSQIHEITGDLRSVGTVEHVHEGITLTVSEVVALGNGILVAVGIDQVVMGLIGGINLAVHNTGTGVLGVGLCQSVQVQAIAVDGDPLAAILGPGKGMEQNIQLSQGLDGDRGGSGGVSAVVSGLSGGSGNGHGAGLVGGDHTVLVHSGNGSVTAGPGNGVIGIEQVDRSAQLHGFTHIDVCLVGLDLDGQVRQSVVGIQGNNGPDIGTEAANLNRGAAIGFEHIDTGSFFTMMESGHDQVTGVFVVIQRASVVALYIAHTLQVQTGTTHKGQIVAVNDFLHILVEESVDDVVVQIAALGHDVILVRITDLVAIEVGGGAHIGDQGCGISAEVSIMGNLVAGSVLDVHHTDTQTLIDDTNQTVEVALGRLGTLSSVGPQPGLVNIGVLGHLEGVGIHAVHGQTVMEVDHIVVHTAGDEVIVLVLHEVTGPLIGIEQIEGDPVDLSVRIIEHTVQGHILDLFHSDLTVLVQVGVGDGSHHNGCGTSGHSIDHAVLADSHNIGVAAFPDDALVRQVPGQHIPVQLELSTDQQGHCASADMQIGRLVGGIQLNAGFLGNDVQAGNITTQTAPCEIGNAFNGSGGHGGLTGLGVQLIQIVVAADGIHGGSIIQYIRVVIPGHGLSGGFAGNGNVIVVCVLGDIAVVSVVDRLQIGHGAVAHILGGPAVQIDILIGAVAVVDGVEVALIVDGQSQQLLVLVGEALGGAIAIGATGADNGNGIHLGHRTVVQVNGIHGVVDA